MEMSLILCGHPLCGKSYYGYRAAEKLKRLFVDTDRLIEKKYSSQKNGFSTCREIMLLEGEQAFRELEKRTLCQLISYRSQSVVVSIGGGSLIDQENAILLKSLGRLIYLKAELSLLLERLELKESIPAYLDQKNPKKSFETLFEKRQKLYLSHADHIIEINHRTDEEIVSLICSQAVGE